MQTPHKTKASRGTWVADVGRKGETVYGTVERRCSKQAMKSGKNTWGIGAYKRDILR